MATTLLLFVGCAFSFSGGPIPAAAIANDARYLKLVESLKDVPIKGGRIGPSTAVHPNAVTREIVGRGTAIVPTLVAALDHSTWRQSAQRKRRRFLSQFSGKINYVAPRSEI